MKAEEARRIIMSDADYSGVGEKARLTADALCAAVDALEKQIPKKPTYEGDGYAPEGTFVWDEWLCPRCAKRYEVDFDIYDFCPNCGQAIDWSDEE